MKFRLNEKVKVLKGHFLRGYKGRVMSFKIDDKTSIIYYTVQFNIDGKERNEQLKESELKGVWF